MGTNLRHLTNDDHLAYAKRIQQVSAMLLPMQEELKQNFESKSTVGRAAQRLSNVQSALFDLQRALADAFHKRRTGRGASTSPARG